MVLDTTLKMGCVVVEVGFFFIFSLKRDNSYSSEPILAQAKIALLSNLFLNLFSLPKINPLSQICT